MVPYLYDDSGTIPLIAEKSIFFTIAWYKTYIENPKKIQNFSINQIKKFSELLNN